MSNDITFKKAPLPPGPSRWQTIRGLQHEVLNFFYASFKKYGDVVRLPFLNKNIYLISHPDDVAHVMQKNLETYSKGGLGYKELKAVLGNGLGPSKGAKWQRQRKLYQPELTMKKVIHYASKVVEVADMWADGWQKKYDQNESINVDEEMLEMNLNVSCNTLIETDIPRETLAKASKEFVHVVQDMEHRVGSLFNLPLFIPTPANIKVKKTFKRIYTFLNNIIEQRQKLDSAPDDLLSVILKGSGHPEDTNTPNLARDHVLNFFFGGHETSGYTLSWLFYLLAKHPEVDQKVSEEIKSVLQGQKPTAESLKQLKYTMYVIQETLRLYPIFPMLPRQCLKDDLIQGFRVPKNTYINICPYLTNRHPDFWDDPEAFIPERFDTEEKQHPFAYIPFGAGRSICVGRNFGMMSTLMIFATLRQRFKLELVEAGDINVLMPGFSLQPEKTIKMKLKKEQPFDNNQAQITTETAA